MSRETALHMAKAREFLRQATSYDAGTMPEAAIHLAYYAMFHAAVAVLRRLGGKAPSKHASVVGQFGRIVADMGEPARSIGRSFNRALDVRLVSDYGTERQDLVAMARRILADAERFVVFCDTWFDGTKPR
ncbi:MAG: HEPN domain-containing protein [Magnetospirillum sp. WYHS-4]